MLRVSILFACGLVLGCVANKVDSQSKAAVYLDLITIEDGQSKYPDPLQLGLVSGRPATLSEAVEELGRIVPAKGVVASVDQRRCSTKPSAPLSDTYQDCKYTVCELLPERSRIQDCGYFVRLEQWVQREWLGGMCLVEDANESLLLTQWFQQRGVNDCSAMSELVMIAYMQQLAGLRWNESELLMQSSVEGDGPVQP